VPRPDGQCIHLHVTGRPTLEWAKQQIRNACCEEQPRFLLHDNDGKFGQLGCPFESMRDRNKARAATPSARIHSVRNPHRVFADHGPSVPVQTAIFYTLAANIDR
jgi:hypothetical protein